MGKLSCGFQQEDTHTHRASASTANITSCGTQETNVWQDRCAKEKAYPLDAATHGMCVCVCVCVLVRLKTRFRKKTKFPEVWQQSKNCARFLIFYGVKTHENVKPTLFSIYPCHN